MKKIDYDNMVLDEEEQWIEDHLEEYEPSPKWVRESLIEAAKKPPVIEYSKKGKKKPVTLRLSENDIEALKTAALRNGLAYQSMITSILHKYLNGVLVDIDEARKVLTPRA